MPKDNSSPQFGTDEYYESIGAVKPSEKTQPNASFGSPEYYQNIGAVSPSAPLNSMQNPEGKNILSKTAEYAMETPSDIWSTVKAIPGSLYGASKQLAKAMLPIESDQATEKLMRGEMTPEEYNKSFSEDPRTRLYKNIVGGTANLVGDISDKAFGVGEKGSNFENIPKHENAVKKLGITDYQPGDEVFQNIGLALAPEAALESAWGRAAFRAGLGGAFSSMQGQNPIAGAAMFGTPLKIPEGIRAPVKNLMLKYTNRELGQGVIRTPEETRQFIEENYTTPTGERLPVDIGTATGSRRMTGLYDTTSAVPFSGGKSQKAAVEKGVQEIKVNQAENEMNAEQQKINEVHDQKIERLGEPLQNLQDELARTQEAENFATNVIEDIPSNLNAIHSNNEIEPGNPRPLARTNLTNALKNDFKEQTIRDNENFNAINEKNIDLSTMATPQDFLESKKLYEDLSKEQKQLEDLFGTDSDMEKSVRDVVSYGKSFFKKPQKSTKTKTDYIKELYNAPVSKRAAILEKMNNENVTTSKPMDLGLMLQHARNLSELAQAAKVAGRDNLSRQLSSASNAFTNDIYKILEKNGMSDVANQIRAAKKFHEENVAPYNNNKALRKTVRYKDHAPDYKEISEELYKEGNSNILRRLPESAQKDSLFGLLTGHALDVNGKTTLTPEQIYKEYHGQGRKGGLDEHQKRVIQELYPQESATLENIGPLFKKREELENQQKAIKQHESERVKQENKISDIEDSRLNELQNATEKRNKFIESLKKEAEPKPKKAGSILKSPTAITSAGGLGLVASSLFSPYLAAAGAALGGAGMIIARGLTKAMAHPDTLEAYLNSSYVKKNPEVINAFNKALKKAQPIISQSVNEEDNQWL